MVSTAIPEIPPNSAVSNENTQNQGGFGILVGEATDEHRGAGKTNQQRKGSQRINRLKPKSQTSLLSQLHSVVLSVPFSLPLYSKLELAAINWTKCRVMGSKKLPLSLSFTVNQHQQLSSIIGGTMCAFRIELEM